MNKIVPLLLISIYPFFLLADYLHTRLITFFDIQNTEFVDDFYRFISLTTILMLSNILIVQYLKPKITGFVFLAWSMLKIMLVMAYFIFFVQGKDLNPANNDIFELVSMYLIFLLYEVVFTVLLIRSYIPKPQDGIMR